MRLHSLDASTVTDGAELCTKIAKALKDTGGAASEYQQVIVELHGLQNVLIRLTAFEPTESNISHVNAIRRMGLACNLPLAEFLAKLERFDSAMAPQAAGLRMREAGRKTQWAVLMAEEVKKIRALISGKVISINLLLATHASETLSRVEDQSGKHQKELFEKLEEERAQMNKIWGEVVDVKNDMIRSREAAYQEASRYTARLEERLDKVDADTASITQGLSSLSIGLASAQTSFVTIRSLGSQIIAFLRTFPAEPRTLLQSIIRTNLRMFAILVSIHEKIATSPTQLLQSNIRVEDALGVVRELPYEWFRYWEVRPMISMWSSLLRRKAIRGSLESAVQEHAGRSQGGKRQIQSCPRKASLYFD